MFMNRRGCKRNATLGLMSSMWNKDSACTGVVEDVSATGIRISQIPSQFGDHFQECLAVVHGPLQDFKLILHPKWRSEIKKNMYQMVGFQVMNPPLNWKQFPGVIFAKSGSEEEVL